jgi:putative glycosyltransferase (TIGR04372 family)
MAQLVTRSQLLEYSRIDHAGQPERPFQILGLLETPALGDLVANVVFLSTLANQFDHARLHVKFRDLRPYSKDIISLSPWIDVAEPLPGEWPKFVQYFFPATKFLRAPFRQMVVGTQKSKKAVIYDLIITSLMAREDAVHGLPNPVPLRLPDLRSDELRGRLIAKGLKPDRWFATFHYRESGYRYRPRGADRDSDPAAFDDLADHIIALGGQAVRLGHSGMVPFRPREGFIDLSTEANSFMLQAAAVSLARFMIAGPSGTMMLAPAFGIPHTFVDVVDTRAYWDVKHGDVLTHVVTTPEGNNLRNASLLASGLLDADRLARQSEAERGYRVRKATSDELAIVAGRLCERTMDCPAWRPPAKFPDGPKPNHFVWPLKLTYPVRWLDV